jgi:hypothetical protein
LVEANEVVGEINLAWLGYLIPASPWIAIAITYGVFRYRIKSVGIDEDDAFPAFKRYLTPFVIASLALDVTAAVVIDIQQTVRGNIPFSVLGSLVFAPPAFGLGVLVGCAFWARVPLSAKPPDD